MGEVYPATDKNLARQVAIGPARVDGCDAERLARFDREAKILAALSHPNIAVVYGSKNPRDTGAGHGVG